MAWRISRDDFPDFADYYDIPEHIQRRILAQMPERPSMPWEGRSYPWQRSHRAPWQGYEVPWRRRSSWRSHLPASMRGDDDWFSWFRKPGNTRLTIFVGIGAAALIGVAAGAALLRHDERHRIPGAAKRKRFAHAQSSITINRPRQELYSFWRDFNNLPKFMDNVEKVQPTGENTFAWTIDAPAGQTVELETRIVDEEEGRMIAWRSIEGSDVETEGRVTFRDAPGGGGTVVSASIAYTPPAGELGRVVAKLFRREPEVQAEQELENFKTLMENGGVTKPNKTKEKSK